MNRAINIADANDDIPKRYIALANLLLEEYIDDYNTLPSYDSPSRSMGQLIGKKGRSD